MSKNEVTTTEASTYADINERESLVVLSTKVSFPIFTWVETNNIDLLAGGGFDILLYITYFNPYFACFYSITEERTY